MRILIIDDEYKTRASLTRLIKRLFPDFQIVGESDNGKEGIKQIQLLQPDLVITDIKMPLMDGLSMISNVSRSTPHTHYLVLTGYAEFELAQKAIRLSVVDYLLKPVSIEQLKTTLQRIADSLTRTSQKHTEEKELTGCSEFVSYVVADIRKNYAQKLYLEDYAKRFQITPEYASNLFSRDTGDKFSTFLRDIRIKKAKELLQTTNLKIYEIAFRTGYSDVKYFCRVFKEVTGDSPKAFARKEYLP